ncbi:MAG TPA: integrase, partial [Cyanobacteria bacterium UBA8543]|nr:integrase [Cyanobacteria bacterium UBA8543]
LSKATKRIRCSHTPDFFIIRQNTAGWEECKTEEELVLLSANKPYRYVRNENGHWRCPPGEEYARKYGLYYAIRSSKDLDPVRLRNFTWLEPYFCKQPPPVNQPIKAAIISLVKALPGIAFSSLILKVQGATPDDINTLIATKQIYVNLSAAPLAEPDKVQIFLNQEIAIAKQQLIQTLPPPVTSAIQVIKVDVGSSLSWDGQPWQIINIGSKTISLQSSDRKVINLTNTAFNELVQKREITCAENQIQSNNHKEFEEILLHARPEDIETANHRYQAIQPYLQPNPPQFPPRSIRRWRDNYWNAEKLYGNGYVGLLPKHHQKGSNEPKLDQAVREFMAQYIAQHYENLKNRRITGVYRAFIEACETHEPKLEPPSEKRFRLEIRQRSGYKQTLSRCGRRAANIQKPYHSAKAIPHHGDLPWEIAHIDHTQLDDELVSSLISLTTCNSSEAISLTDINLGRPWVSFMIDSYSRRILAVYLTYEEPSYRSCMMVMRICVSRFRRLPQIIVTDNGKEFHSTYFNQLLAYYQCTHKYRPPGEPRYGAPVERIFNTNNTQWTHELKGNTQILRIPRQVTQSVSPKKQAVWTIGEFYKFLEYWA